MTKLARITIGFIWLAVFLLFTPAAFASTLHLSPGSLTIGVGEVRSVAVRLNAGGEAVNGVSAFLSYPADKLEVTSVSGGSAFNIAAEGSFGGGSVRISRGSLSPVSGNVLVASIAVKGKAAGSATVFFVGGSAAPRASDSSESLNLGGSSGLTVNVVAGKTVTGSKTATPAPSGDQPTAITISDIKVSRVSTASATIAWKTNIEADSLVEYGLSKGQYILTASDKKQVTDHTIELSGPLLTPGALFHFRVKSIAPSGMEAASEDQTVTLTGYEAVLVLTDAAGSPLTETEVTVYDMADKFITDGRGEVRIGSLTPGKHLLIVRFGDLEKTATFEVKDTPDVQRFDIKVAGYKTSLREQANLAAYQGWYTIILGGLAVSVALAVAFFYRKRLISSSPPNPPSVPKQL